MAGFAMMPSAPFEGEVCVAGAWAIAQAQCATVFCSRKPLCLNGMWGFLYLRKLHRQYHCGCLLSWSPALRVVIAGLQIVVLGGGAACASLIL